MASTMKEKPMLMPIKWGSERLSPWFTPDANIIKLLGPGVMEVMAAKAPRVHRSQITHHLWWFASQYRCPFQVAFKE
jgi:hypothetical protein